LTVLFPPLNGGGNGVAYGYKGKGILIHSITDANGMPLVAITTPANGDERQLLPMLAQIRLATGKRGNPKRRPKTLAADKGYDARWLRNKLRTYWYPTTDQKTAHQREKAQGQANQGHCTALSTGALFLLVSTQVSTTRCSMGTPESLF
jgi:transposase